MINIRHVRHLQIIPRSLVPALQQALDVFSVVVVVGPRQVGKTTLVQAPEIGADRLYLTLDDLDLLSEARRHPDRLLGRAARITLDEVQRAPEVLLAIKRHVDRERSPGQFIVTGSADVRAMKQVADHLPGRAVYLNLEPLSAAELRGEPEQVGLETLLAAASAVEARDALTPRGRRRSDVVDLMIRGGLPEPALLRDDDARVLWFAAYVRSWLDRGVGELSAISELADLKRLMTALAARTGGLLNQAAAGAEIGLPRTTAYRYTSVLSLGLLLDLLPAWSRSLRVRTVKTPKLYWRDVGLAAHLLGIRSRKALREHHGFGVLVENLILANLRAWASARRHTPELFFWRTAGGREVDFVVEVDGRFIPVEVKLARRPRAEDLRHLVAFLEEHRRIAPYGVLLHGGTTVETPAPNVVAVPLAAVL